MNISFYETANKITLPSEEAGLAILAAIMKNRIDNEPPYKRGDVKNFRNLEQGRVLRCLEMLASDDEKRRIIPTPEWLVEEYSESRLDKDRDRPFEVIAYGYDAAKYKYQQIKGDRVMKIVSTAEFLGDKVLTTARKATDDVLKYGRKKESPVAEYIRILKNLRNALNDTYGIGLGSPE